MPAMTNNASKIIRLTNLPDRKGLHLFYYFSSTLLSTIRYDKLLHLILTVMVSKRYNLFTRAALFIYDSKTNSLNGTLGVSRKEADLLELVAVEPARQLSGHWDLSDEAIQNQQMSELSAATRKITIDLPSGCKTLAKVIKEQRTCTMQHGGNQSCQTCMLMDSLEIGSFTAVPLVTHKQLIGIIIAGNSPEQAEINRKQLNLLQLFANQASVAIENAQLYKNLAETHKLLQDARHRLVHTAHLAAIGEMAASLTHELKTPLVAIGGFAVRLSRLLQDDPEQRHCLNTIISESHRLERLLGDVLSFSRKPTICYMTCNLMEILQSCLNDYRPIFDSQFIIIESNLPEDEAWMMLGDSSQLKQVFINLIVNAQEAMPDGGRLNLELAKLVESGRPYAVVRVRDSGGGIPEENIERILSPFFTTKRHGTGLGLAIVNRIVTSHGGTISVTNVSNGAEFTVQLPLT